MIWIMLILSFDGTAAKTYQAKLENQKPAPGYSRIRVDGKRRHYTLDLTIHPHKGCLVRFDKPYDDTWASDAGGEGGGFYHYAQMGGDHTMVVISNVTPTKTEENLFFLFGDIVVELTLRNAKADEGADTRVEIRFAEPKPLPKPPAKPKEVQTPIQSDWITLITDPEVTTITTPHGVLHYRFDGEHPFTLFRTSRHAPVLEVMEIVRGKKPRRGVFDYEFPLMPRSHHQIETYQLARFDHLVLNRGERLYLRVKFRGEQTATVYPLTKRGRL